MTTTSTLPGFVYDLGIILGTPSSAPLPASEPGAFLVRVPELLSLDRIADSPLGQQLMHRQNWYRSYKWSKVPVTPGIYCLRLPIANSHRKRFQEQLALLVDGEQPAPVVLVAAAMLLHHQESQPDPLNDGWARCDETAADGYRVELTWYHGRLYVYNYWDGDRNDRVWLAAVRRAS